MVVENYILTFRSASNYSIIKATSHDDISFAIEYCRRVESWKLAVHDDEIFFALAPQRCYYGMLGDEKISYMQIVLYGDNEEYCYPGMYVVKKEYREQNYGRPIFDHAWGEIPDSSLISFSAIIPKVLLYMEYGGKPYWNECYYMFDAQKILNSLELDSYEKSINIIRYKDADFQSLLRYDTNAFCYSREIYLRKVGQLSGNEGWVATDPNGQITGYVVARQALDFSEWLLFPLIADNLSVAKALLMELSRFLVNQPAKSFTMVIPNVNTCAITFAEKLKGKKVSETRRMFANGPPSDKMVKNHAELIFGTNPSLG